LYQAIPYTDRLNYNSAILANVGYCLAVEKLLDLETPERCQWLRTMASELSRLGDHLTRCGAACLELSAMTPFLFGIEARELTWDLMEILCGARVTSNYVRIGGVKHDMPPSFPGVCRENIAKIRALLRDYESVVTQNRLFVDRLRGTGMIAKQTLIDYAVTGPLLRAAGVPMDLRKDQPYLKYAEVDFDVPIGEVSISSIATRFCVEEMQPEPSHHRQCLVALRRPARRTSTSARSVAREGRVFNRMKS
jgi:NADH-quinone oxidoreductase subunit D